MDPVNKYQGCNAGDDAQFSSMEPFYYYFGHISESTLQTKNSNGQHQEMSYLY